MRKDNKKVECRLESILDLNSNNVWQVDAFQIAKLWEECKTEEDFATSEQKLLNIMRLGFEVVHYDPSNTREAAKYENGDWALFSHIVPSLGSVAIRKKYVTRLNDLSYENIRHITTATLLELIDNNFGGGWDSIQLSLRDVIESAFEVSTTQLPTSRLHAPGSILEKNLAQGFEVLEITKGTWTEAIFVKKKEPAEKLRCVRAEHYDDEGNLILPNDPDDESQNDLDDEFENEDMSENEEIDETYYSSYSPEADVKEEDEEGFPVEEE